MRYILSALAIACAALAWLSITPPTQPAVPAEQLATAATSLAAEPIAFQRQADALVATGNPSGLDIRVDGQGLTVRHAQNGTATLRLVGLSADGQASALPAGAPTMVNPLVTERWQGAVHTRAWNRDDGVATVFTVTRDAAAQDELALAIEVDTDGLVADLVRGDDIHFRDATGTVRFAYSGAEVEDAEGRRLPSSLTLVDGQPVLRVDTRGARYPLTAAPVLRAVEPIDPVLSATAPPLQSFMGKISIFVESMIYRPLSSTEAGVYGAFGFYNPNLDYTLPANLAAFAAKVAQIELAIGQPYATAYPDNSVGSARWNFEHGIVVLPVGSQNRFSGVANRGQITTFPPGRPTLAGGFPDDYVAFEVRLDSGPYAQAVGTNLVWSANGKTTTFGHPASYVKVNPTFTLTSTSGNDLITSSTQNAHAQKIKIELPGGNIPVDPQIPIDGQIKTMAQFAAAFDPAVVDVQLGSLPNWTWNRCSVQIAPGLRIDQTMSTKFLPGTNPSTTIDIPDSATYLRAVWALNGHADAVVIDSN